MTRVINKGVYDPANASIFTGIPSNIDITVVKPANDLLTQVIAEAKGNHEKMTDRGKQVKIVFELLKEILMYAAPIVKNDLSLIAKSGFDASNDPTAHGVPDVPVITKMTPGKEANSLKAHLKKRNISELVTHRGPKKARLKYSLQASATPGNTGSWTNKAEGESSRDLIASDVPDLMRIWYRARAEDGKLKSAWSAPVPYPPLPGTGTTPTTGTGTTPPTG